MALRYWTLQVKQINWISCVTFLSFLRAFAPVRTMKTCMGMGRGGIDQQILNFSTRLNKWPTSRPKTFKSSEMLHHINGDIYLFHCGQRNINKGFMCSSFFMDCCRLKQIQWSFKTPVTIVFATRYGVGISENSNFHRYRCGNPKSRSYITFWVGGENRTATIMTTTRQKWL